MNEKLETAMEDLGMKEGFDVGLEMSGNAQAFRQMIDSMNHGGKVALLGILPSDAAIEWNKVIFKGLFLKGIYGREMFETWYKMVSMLQSGLDISPVLTHHFKVNDFQEGFDVMRSGKSGKVVLDWN
jgi:threonine 3-dehydrogenase